MRQDRRIRGVIHIHTDLSFDGSLTVSRIASMCRDRGLSFAAVSDHAEDADDDSFARLVATCSEFSGPDFVMIPGLEHRYLHGVHVLALGQRRLISAASTIDTLRALAREGCPIIAAHCVCSHDLPRELLEILSAVEIWNVGRDTRLLPTTRHLPAYRKLASEYPALCAIGGLDMHKGHEWACEIEIETPSEVRPQAILAALRSGRFRTRSRFFTFGSRPGGGLANIAFMAGDALVAARDLRDRLLRDH